MSGGKGKGKGKKERSISPPTPRDSSEGVRGRGRRSMGKSDSNDDEFEEAKDKFDESDLAVPQTMTGRTSQGDSSPARTSSKFMEEL